MKKMQTSLLVIGGFLLFNACTTTRPVPYNAAWKGSSLYFGDTEADETDMKSRLRFGVRNNENTLFFVLKTREPELIRRIVTNGARLSFRPEGSRKDYSKLWFPVVLKEDRRALRKMDRTDQNALKFLLETYNKEALWDEGQGQHFINLLEEQAGIKCRLELSPDGELSAGYEVPLARAGVKEGDSGLELALQIEDSGSGSGFSPGISVGVGTGGFGMGGMGVGIGTGRRNGYGNQAVGLRVEVKLARSEMQDRPAE